MFSDKFYYKVTRDKGEEEEEEEDDEEEDEVEGERV